MSHASNTIYTYPNLIIIKTCLKMDVALLGTHEALIH